MSAKNKKGKVYPRVSSSDQEDGTSLGTQRAECIKLANSLGYPIEPEDVLLEVGSGADLDRGQLTKLRHMAAAGEFDALFVYSADRLSRDPVELLVLLREFAARGVEVHFVQGPSASASQAEFINAVIEVFANQERCKHWEMIGYTPPIISKEMFQKVQERLGKAQARFRGDGARPRLLVGSVRCGSCGASMGVRAGAGKRCCYRCSGASRSGAQQGAGSGECRARVVKADWPEDQVWSHVVAMVQGPSGVIADLELNCQTRVWELGQEIERLRGEVQKEERREVRLLNLCNAGTLRLELLVARMEESSSLLADLRVRLAELDEQRAREENALAACERVREYCLMVSASLEGLDVACKRDVMMRLGVKVLVVQGEVTITAEIDLDLW